MQGFTKAQRLLAGGAGQGQGKDQGKGQAKEARKLVGASVTCAPRGGASSKPRGSRAKFHSRTSLQAS